MGQSQQNILQDLGRADLAYGRSMRPIRHLSPHDQRALLLELEIRKLRAIREEFQLQQVMPNADQKNAQALAGQRAKEGRFNDRSRPSKKYPFEYPQAGLSYRIWANVIDLIFVMVVILIAGMGVYLRGIKSTDYNFFLYMMLSGSFALFYVPVGQSFGFTFGQFLTGIRVRRRNGEKLDLSYSFMRFFFTCLLAIPSCLLILISQDKKGFHEVFSDSITLRKVKRT